MKTKQITIKLAPDWFAVASRIFGFELMLFPVVMLLTQCSS